MPYYQATYWAPYPVYPVTFVPYPAAYPGRQHVQPILPQNAPQNQAPQQRPIQIIGIQQLSAEQHILPYEREKQLAAGRQWYVQQPARNGPQMVVPNAHQNGPVAQQNVNQQPQGAPVAVAGQKAKMGEGDAQATKSILAQAKSLPDKLSVVKPLGNKWYALPSLIISLASYPAFSSSRHCLCKKLMLTLKFLDNEKMKWVQWERSPRRRSKSRTRVSRPDLSILDKSTLSDLYPRMGTLRGEMAQRKEYL
jgi:hypothetical protein